MEDTVGALPEGCLKPKKLFRGLTILGLVAPSALLPRYIFPTIAAALGSIWLRRREERSTVMRLEFVRFSPSGMEGAVAMSSVTPVPGSRGCRTAEVGRGLGFASLLPYMTELAR